MPRNQQYSISKKLTLMNMLASAVALLLASGGFCAYDLYSSRMALVRSVSIQAEIIGDNTVSALLFNDPNSAEKTLSALRANPNLMYAQIYTRGGQAFAGYWRDSTAETSALPTIPAGQIQNHWFKDGHGVNEQQRPSAIAAMASGLASPHPLLTGIQRSQRL